MAHNNFSIVEKLLSLIDDERNDIYIHIDRRTQAVPFDRLKAAVKHGTLCFIPRIAVQWGGDSQIKVTLMLLKEAVKTDHSYYHFISGVDMPLKTQDEFHQFFEENQGKEFIGFDRKFSDELIKERIGYYYPFQNRIGRSSGKIVAAFYYAQNALIKIQKMLHVDRTKNSGFKLYKGAQWFSITHEFAKYLVSQEKVIYKYFGTAINADEVFVQTLVCNSKFKDSLANSYMRCIDWQRGAPYTFTIEDFDMLMSSNMFFARKFDEKVDMEIVNRIYTELKCQQESQGPEQKEYPLRSH